MKRVALLILSALLSANILAGGTDEREAPREHIGLNQVELRLRDGSVLLGEISGLDAIALKTAYGTLTFPISHILRVRAGFRLSKAEESEILAAIKELDSDEFNVRGLAQKKLEEHGAAAVTVLRENKEKVSAEARSRIDAVLKRITENNPKLVVEDMLKSDEFEATGTLQFETLTIKGHIGEVKVKLEDLEGIRFLANGTDRNLTLEASNGLDEWMDTGVDASPGEKMAIACAGSVNLFGNTQTGPEGNTNWGNRPFLTGAVVAKLGDNGKPFLIGTGKQWTPSNRQRLYVKIFCAENVSQNNTNGSTGEFKVRVATGTWAEEPLTVTEESEPSAPRRHPKKR